MASPAPFIAEALSSLRAMLEADGYRLALDAGVAMLIARIEPGPDACADCLVPKDMMLRYFEAALRPVCELGMPEIQLVYPGESA